MSASIRCSKCHNTGLVGTHCLAHLSDSELGAAANRLQDGVSLIARDVEVSARMLGRLLRLARRNGRPAHIASADFQDARFVDGTVHFESTYFSRKALFTGAQFGGDAHFDRAVFSRTADFRQTHFSGEADFRRVVAAQGYFEEAQFVGEARFDRAGFSQALDLRRVSFRRRTSMGRVVVAGKLALDNAVFDEDVRLDAIACELSCERTRFSGRADLNVCWADINLAEATFAYSSRLAGVWPPAKTDGKTRAVIARAWRDWEWRGGKVKFKPKLVSIQQARVESLALQNLDLSMCRFFGAHGLDRMSIDVSCDFDHTPRGARYTRRRIVPEEREKRWPHESQSPAAPAIDYGDIAAVYRALRKALEDHKDEPGAADFYYGEMEMRRLTRPNEGAGLAERLASFGERLILRLYWLVSGYGLRASRALVALLLTVGLFALAFDAWGFDDQPFWRCLLFSAQSTTSLFKAPDEPKPEPVGEALQLMLRLLGPLFFALALLSLRGRVKR